MTLTAPCLVAYGVIMSLHAASYFTTVPLWVFSVLSASLTIFIGSNLCVTKAHVEGGDDSQIERLSRRDAMMFPVFGSVAIFSIYIALKYLDEYWINFVARLYFSVIGVYVIEKTFRILMNSVLPQGLLQLSEKEIFSFNVANIPVIGSYMKEAETPEEAHKDQVNFTLGGIPTLALACAVAFFYLKTNFWMLNNLYGVCFAVQALALIDIGSFKTAGILLVLLFFYDIFWVFGTEVMVSVATKFDVPIKLLFPRNSEIGGHNLLGLGDIVIPGLLITLMAKLDVEQLKKNIKSQYFNICLLAYVLSLAFTLYINIVFKHPQPALLYLVPGCLLAVIILSFVRGEFKVLFNFSTEEPKEEESKNDKKDN